MNSDINIERRVPKIKLAALYIISLILIIIILSAFWGPLPALPKQVREAKLSGEAAQASELLSDVYIIHERFTELEKLYEKHIKEPSGINETSVAAAEESFKKTMDSLEMKSKAYSSTNTRELHNIFSTLRLALNHKLKANDLPVQKIQSLPSPGIQQDSQQWKKDIQSKNLVIADLQSQLKLGQNIISEDRQSLAGSQKEMQFKNARIAELEIQLNNRAKESGAIQQTLIKLQKEIQNKNNTISALEKNVQIPKNKEVNSGISSKEVQKLKSDNKYLALALSSQYKQTNDLTQINKLLRADIEKLKKPLQ